MRDSDTQPDPYIDTMAAQHAQEFEAEGGSLAMLLEAVRVVDEWLDSDMSPEYRAQPLAHDWARITKVCSEAGEVMDALSKSTGENPRKGVCATEDDLLGELGDTACAAIFAIQHRTKDVARTWAIFLAATEKAHRRATVACCELPRNHHEWPDDPGCQVSTVY